LEIKQQHKFIDITDDTARLINDRANHLYEKLALLNFRDIDIDDFGKYYFTNHHTGTRLFFSVQSSADIIYRSVKKTNKSIPELSFIDYGAGLGTLFLMAGMVGFNKVYFNDYFPRWAGYAKIICDKLDITIDDYISGDIDAVINYSKANHVHYDILASRNVAEHIYNLRDFYGKLYLSGITTVCYATTTANYHNLAMRLKHYWHHYQVEKKIYKKQRTEYLKELIPVIKADDLHQLVKLTKGKAFDDFTITVDKYFEKEPIPKVEFLRTNTCDCKTGVWAENLITRKNYADIIQTAGFKFEYTAGFWDTHYKYAIVNLITCLLNRLIKMTGKKGYWFAPFVNITAQ
jgi:hypothetical protein